MFESPGSIIAFMCATFPFVLMWMYDYIYDIFLPYARCGIFCSKTYVDHYQSIHVCRATEL